MSAWIVSKRHIDALAMLIDAELPDIASGLIVGNPQTRRTIIGGELWRENVASVSYRYEHRYDDENPDVDAYVWEDPKLGQELENPYYVLKAIGCYDYQSCEHPGWEASWSNAACGALQDKIKAMLPDGGDRYYDHPAYDRAPWGIDDLMDVDEGADNLARSVETRWMRFAEGA